MIPSLSLRLAVPLAIVDSSLKAWKASSSQVKNAPTLSLESLLLRVQPRSIGVCIKGCDVNSSGSSLTAPLQGELGADTTRSGLESVVFNTSMESSEEISACSESSGLVAAEATALTDSGAG